MSELNQLFKIALKIIDNILAEGFFLNPEYKQFQDDYYRKKYPYKYEDSEESINEDERFEDSEESINKDERSDKEYIHEPDIPNINEFINLWYYNPIKNHNLFIYNDLIVDKLKCVYSELRVLPIEQQKGILLLLLPKFNMVCGYGDLLYLDNYIKIKYPEVYKKSIQDLNIYSNRASGEIERDLANYYCSLVSNNVESRKLISDRVYIVILIELGIVKYGVDYKQQSEYAFSLIDNHTMFKKIRVKTEKPKSVENVIKQYFSENKTTIFIKAIPEAIKLIKEFELKSD